MKIFIAAILLSLSVNIAQAQVPDWMKTVTTASFSCEKKYCKRMSSCSEAYHKMTQCGLKGLDRDKDGIPCENVCGKTLNGMKQLLKQGR